MSDVGCPSDSMVSHVWMRIARLFNRLYVSRDLQSASGASMSDNQSGKSEKKQPYRRIVLIGAGATVLAIINMSVGSEAQSQPVLILEYAALVGGLFALIGGLILMMMQR
jgi:hypothetical protein